MEIYQGLFSGRCLAMRWRYGMVLYFLHVLRLSNIQVISLVMKKVMNVTKS